MKKGEKVYCGYFRLLGGRNVAEDVNALSLHVFYT